MDPLKRLSIIILTGLLVVSQVLAQEDKITNDLLNEADQLISAGQLTEALEKTEAAVRQSPSSITALQKRINVYFLLNNEKEAIYYVEDAIGKYPSVAEFYYLRGTINNARGKFNKALDDFDKAISLEPSENQHKNYLGRGVSYFNLLEYEQALSDLSASIELNDTVASAYHSRAMINYELRDYTAAVNDFIKTLDLSEGNAALYFNLGMSYYRLNENDKACPYFHKSCTMGNTNACRMTLMECTKAIPAIP